MKMDQARMARTEAAFREVNEAIAQTAARFDADEVDFICECADPHCAHRVNAELEEYEEVRERVVEHTPDFDVVEKVVPRMRRIVRRLNPRAAPAT
jgi:hypothetical protein